MPDGSISRKSKLLAVKPKAAAPSKPKVLIFGKPGVGKTWTSLSFPTVFYLDTEGGADMAHYTDKLERSGGVYLGPEQGSMSFDTVIGQVQALATEQHPYRTLVIDSISKLYNTAIVQEQERLGDKDAYGASKRPALQFMRRLVLWINRLDMNVIMIAHEKDLWGNDGKTGVTFDCDPKLEYELHLCLNVIKQGPRRLARVGKSRLLGFPEGETFEWDYDVFADRYGRDVIESDARPMELATAEDVAEIKRLLDTVKLPDGQAEKWLTAAGVSDWEEMDREKILKSISFLKSKVAG